MTDVVLVPVDGSPLSLRALRHALEAFPDAEITVYHVVDLFDPDYAGRTGSTYEPMVGSAEWDRFVAEARDQVFAEVTELVEDCDRSITTDTDVGDPKRLVVEYATEEAVDHVVVGAHGRSRSSRPFFGTVAERVVRRSPVPVTVVR